MTLAPKVFVLVAAAAEPSAVVATLAALQACGAQLRAHHDSRFGAETEGAVDWVMRALGGDAQKHLLAGEIESFRPDAVVCFEAESAAAACALRDESARPFAVVAVMATLVASAAWVQCDVDRFLVVDDEAAVGLEELGVEGDIILPVGAIAEIDYVSVGSQDRKTLKSKLGLSGPIVLVLVEDLSPESCGELSLQLSLIKAPATYLFDAGDNTVVASALRSQVPLLDMKAKLFGRTEDAPQLWRSADVVVGEATPTTVARACVVGAKMVCLEPAAGVQSHIANALVERGLGSIAANPLMVGSAVQGLLAAQAADCALLVGADGAGNAAEAVYVIASQRSALVEERQVSQSSGRKAAVESAGEFATWAQESARPAGGLEDLGGGSSGAGGASTTRPSRPGIAKLRRLLAEIEERKKQVSRTLGDAQKQIGLWEKRHEVAEVEGNPGGVKAAERSASLERARMHKALAELSILKAEEETLRKASSVAASMPAGARETSGSSPSRVGREGANTSRTSTSTSSRRRSQPRLSVADELERLRQRAESGSDPRKPSRKPSRKPARKRHRPSAGAGRREKKEKSAIDDELAALKRKMAQKRRGS